MRLDTSDTKANLNYINLIIRFKKHFINNAMFYFTAIIIFIKTLILNKYLVDKSIFFYNLYYSILYFLSCTSCIMIFLSFSFLFKNRLRNWYLFFINTIFSLVCIIDIIYYKAFNRLPSIFTIYQIKDANTVFKSIVSLLETKYVIFIIDLILILVIFYMRRKQNSMHPVNIQAFIMLFIIFRFYIMLFIRYEAIKVDVIRYSLLFSPLAYHVYDTYLIVNEGKNIVLNENEIKEIEDWYKQKNASSKVDHLKSIFREKNVIFIQYESLESFVIGRSYNGVEISPTLNSLINNSLYFSNIYEQVNEGTSSDANFMVNTSIYPLRRGCTFYNYANNTYNALPNILKKYGYFSSDINPEYGGFWNWENNQKSFGFERTYNLSYFEKDYTVSHYVEQSNFRNELSEKEYYEKIIPIIKKQKQPFYSVISNFASHTPFWIPNEHKELNLKEPLAETILGAYLESVHYTDKQLGMFLNKLDENRLLDNTIIVVYGDHEGVHKYYQEEIDKLNLTDNGLVNNNRKIPIIIYKKGFIPKEITVHGGLVDLMPTVCYLVGVEDSDYINTAMGRNLLNTKEDYTILANEDFIGNDDQVKKQHAQKGLYIADKIIKGDYFTNYVIVGE